MNTLKWCKLILKKKQKKHRALITISNAHWAKDLGSQAIRKVKFTYKFIYKYTHSTKLHEVNLQANF